MATVVRENVGLLHDKLTVKITKEDYLPTFEKKLKEYTKSANIPGFRKGMVPVGMVKKMYGGSIFVDEVLKTVEKELFSYLNNEKPEIFAQPLPLDQNDASKVDMNNPTEYEFGFEMGLKPSFELPKFDAAKAVLHKVEATDAMVDEEVEAMREKAGNLIPADLATKATDILNLKVGEKELVRELAFFAAAAQDVLKTKKVDDTLTLKLSEAIQENTIAAISKELALEEGVDEVTFTVTKVQTKEKRELDEAFFKEVYPTKDIKTLEELKASLKEEIQSYWNGQSNNQIQDQLYHFILDETKMEFPSTFLKRWLQNGGEKVKTAEEAETEYPSFEGQLKWTLISDKLITDNNLQVSNEELREYVKAQVAGYFGGMQLGDDTSWLESYVDRMMKDEKQIDATYRRMITEKLFGWMQSQVKPSEKVVTKDEFAAMMQNHQH